MKDLWKSGILILLIIGVIYIIFLRECKHLPICPPDNTVLVPRQTWDSILALANKPPQVTIDTVWVTKPVTEPDPQPPLPDPQPVGDSINFYADSLVNSEIGVWVDLKIKGELLSREWRYTPIVVEINKDSIIYIPEIVYVSKSVKTPQNGLYGYGIAGGNSGAFLFGGGVDFITKKDTELGYMYQRYGSLNFHSIKIGAKIKFKKY